MKPSRGGESRVREEGPGAGAEQLEHLVIETRAWHTFSVKDQRVNVLGFIGHTGCVATTRLCCCSTETARDSSQISVMALFQQNFSCGL